jgi:hypothetical protein
VSIVSTLRLRQNFHRVQNNKYRVHHFPVLILRCYFLQAFWEALFFYFFGLHFPFLFFCFFLSSFLLFFLVLNYLCKVYWLTIRYCDDLNFAANRNFSRTPTSGTGRDETAREGAKGIKGGTDAILMGFTTVAPCVCVCVCLCSKGGD